MEVTINEREYELKELTKEEAKAYIGKEVFVWDLKTTSKRKLLEVFEPDCLNPFCILESGGKSTYYYPHCAPVPEEWYVYETPDGNFFHSNEYQDNKKVDHGSHDYCVMKARKLNEQKESAEHPLTNYELGQLLKSLGVECRCDCSTFTDTAWCYTNEQEKEIPYLEGLQIRYKCGEWMPATRETVLKWWRKESNDSDFERFVSFMGWFEDKE